MPKNYKSQRENKAKNRSQAHKARHTQVKLETVEMKLGGFGFSE